MVLSLTWNCKLIIDFPQISLLCFHCLDYKLTDMTEPKRSEVVRNRRYAPKEAVAAKKARFCKPVV